MNGAWQKVGGDKTAGRCQPRALECLCRGNKYISMEDWNTYCVFVVDIDGIL